MGFLIHDPTMQDMWFWVWRLNPSCALLAGAGESWEPRLMIPSTPVWARCNRDADNHLIVKTPDGGHRDPGIGCWELVAAVQFWGPCEMGTSKNECAAWLWTRHGFFKLWHTGSLAAGCCTLIPGSVCMGNCINPVRSPAGWHTGFSLLPRMWLQQLMPSFPCAGIYEATCSAQLGGAQVFDRSLGTSGHVFSLRHDRNEPQSYASIF